MPSKNIALNQVFDNVDCLQVILSYFDAKSLCVVESVSHNMKTILEDCYTWEVLCDQRWKCSKRVRKVLGVQSWKMAYRIMMKRQRLPKGLYTEKFNRSFGKGRKNGIDSWVLLGHTSNAKPSLRYGLNVMDIRLCVQNVYNSCLAFKPADAIKILCSNEDLSVYKMNSPNIRLAALNGKRIEQSDKRAFEDIKLYPLDFAVFSCEVILPNDVFYETDLLARLSSLELIASKLSGESLICPKYTTKVGYNKDLEVRARIDANWENICVVNKIIDEKTMWDAYVELPGGIVLMRDASMMTD